LACLPGSQQFKGNDGKRQGNVGEPAAAIDQEGAVFTVTLPLQA
jgi:hypothetical protein